jgi:hypothetical protein
MRYGAGQGAAYQAKGLFCVGFPVRGALSANFIMHAFAVGLAFSCQAYTYH